MSQIVDVVVIGAGQAGLAAGYHLGRAGVNYLIVDANVEIGGSWHHYWDSVTLFSPAKYSQLPGMAFPGDPDQYPNRTEVIAYLQDYADHFNMPVYTDFRVTDVRQSDGYFHVCDDQGNRVCGWALIVATGAFNRPYIPEIPGVDSYSGCMMHSYQYRRPDAFAGQRIAVVGSNNSAVQIGYELATVADVSLAIRRPIQWAPQRFLGKSVFFWFHDTGFDMLPLGYWLHLDDINKVFDDGRYRSAVAAGRPDTRPMFTAFTERGVVWGDGLHEEVDTVLFATGFRPDNVPFLDNLNALCDKGMPHERGGVSTTVDGLYFVGRFGQLSSASATLRGVGRDAQFVVKRLVRDLRVKG